MLPYSHGVELLALFYTTLAILAIYLGGKLYAPARSRQNSVNSKSVVTAGLIAFLFGLVLNYLYLWGIGAFSGGFIHAQFIESRSASFAYPYIYVLVPALSAIALFSSRTRYVWLLYAMFAVPNLIVGSRHESLLLLVAIIASRALRGIRLTKRWLFITLSIGLVAGVLVGATRGGATLTQVMNNQRLLLYPLTEFSRPFSSLLYYIKNPKYGVPGATIYDGLVASIPKEILPVNRPQSPGVQFAQELWQRAGGVGRATGQGYSPVAEALVNYTFIGIPIFFFVLALGLRVWGAHLRKTKWTFFNSVLCVVMIDVGRGGLFTIIPFIIYALIVAFLILVLTNEVYRLRYKKNIIYRRS